MEQNGNTRHTPAEGAGGQTLAGPTAANDPQGSGKNFVKKRKGRLTKREIEEWNALCKQKAPTNEPDGREAAYDDLVDHELCCDLAEKFASESGRTTEAKEIGSIRDNYEAIALRFIGVRSLSVVLRNEPDQAPEDFLRKLGNWIGDYVSYCIQGKEDRCNWTLGGHTVSKELLTALALEYDRDRAGLMQFLSAVFARWREIDQPDSLFRQRLLTHQLAGTPKEIAKALEKIGAASWCTTPEQFESLHGRVKQYCSRDRKKALQKRQKAQ